MIKKENFNLQITLKPSENKDLEDIRNQLKKNGKKPTKSKTISFLIDYYKATKEQEQSEEYKREIKFYSIALKELKKKLNVNCEQLAKLLNMNANTIRNLITFNISRPPKKKDQETIKDFLKAYKINITL